MKKTLLYIIIALSLGCSAQEKRISKIEVKKVSFEISTVIPIECDRFDYCFENSYSLDVHTVTESSKLEKLQTIIKNFKRKNVKDDVVDPRQKIIIFYSDNSKVTLCIDFFGLMLNGNIMEIDKKDLEFLHNL